MTFLIMVNQIANASKNCAYKLPRLDLDFSEALRALLATEAPGLSASTVVQVHTSKKS